MLLLAPKTFLVICICSIYGLFVGSVPGLSATLAASLLIPFTFFMDPVPALVSIVTMSAMAIFAGDIPAAVVLMSSAPLLAEVAMKFSSFEYFWLAALGLSATVMVSRGSQVKGALAMVLGLFLSTIGVDITLGYPRLTFGNVDLLNGISFIPAMIGVFGISEVMRNVMEKEMNFAIARGCRRERFFGAPGSFSGVIR
jgi:putative tricarboxylic transport membrane protein